MTLLNLKAKEGLPRDDFIKLKSKKGSEPSGWQDSPQTVVYTNDDGPALWE